MTEKKKPAEGTWTHTQKTSYAEIPFIKDQRELAQNLVALLQQQVEKDKETVRQLRAHADLLKHGGTIRDGGK